MVLWPQPTNTVPVVVAKHDVARFQRLSSNDVETIALPAGALHPDAVRAEEVAGQYATVPLLKGEQVLHSHLSGEGQGAANLGEIATGHAAMAVPVQPDSVPVGLLTPGSAVDVLYSAGQQSSKTFSQLLVRGVRLIGLQDEYGRWWSAPDRTAAQERSLVRAVILEVDGEEAERLAYAMTYGQIMVVAEGLAGPVQSSGGVDAARILLPPSEDFAQEGNDNTASNAPNDTTALPNDWLLTGDETESDVPPGDASRDADGTWGDPLWLYEEEGLPSEP